MNASPISTYALLVTSSCSTASGGLSRAMSGRGSKSDGKGFFQVHTHELVNSLDLDTWSVDRNYEVSIGANEPHLHPVVPATYQDADRSQPW